MAREPFVDIETLKQHIDDGLSSIEISKLYGIMYLRVVIL